MMNDKNFMDSDDEMDDEFKVQDNDEEDDKEGKSRD
jgi:hypothetical protein